MGLYERNYLMHHGIKGQRKGGAHHTAVTDHEHDNEVKRGPYNRGNNLSEDEFKVQYIKKCERIIDKELKNINRRFTEGDQWQYNCGNCTMAVELLSHGIGATAKSNWDEGLFPEVLEQAFGVEKYEVITSKSYKQVTKDIEETIKSQGSNSSGSIQLYWGENGNLGCHYVHYTNTDGKITIEDGQSNVKFNSVGDAMKAYDLIPDNSGYFNAELTRLDNGIPNYDVLQNYVNLKRK